MPDRIAVLCDIHGNLPALEAVLADVDAIGVDRIVLDGDLADGPFPVETLDRLAALGDRALWLRGNGDRWLVETRAGTFTHADPATEVILRWSAARLHDHHLERLAALPLTAVLDVAGRRIGLCHATARSDDEMVLVDSALEHARAAFADLDGEIVVAGHCHMPYDRLVAGRRLVNAGSVGMPYGHAGASWALVGADVVLKRTQYDVEDAAARIAGSGMPGADDFVATYVRGRPSDAEALDAYHTIVRTQQADPGRW
jgi:putative phosphoesterase